jgi:GABA(A) receptor-associated protein
MPVQFKKMKTFTERQTESKYILSKYTDRVPIICEKSYTAKNVPDIDKNKYLLPFDITVGQFMYVIRKRIVLSSEQALFIFINGTIPSNSELMSSIYEKYKDNDGFLYITYSSENTFG